MTDEEIRRLAAKVDLLEGANREIRADKEKYLQEIGRLQEENSELRKTIATVKANNLRYALEVRLLQADVQRERDKRIEIARMRKDVSND